MYVHMYVCMYVCTYLCMYVKFAFLNVLVSFPDCSLNIKLKMLCRVGHVCAACFIEYKWAFRLLWLQCFKPYEHQYAGKVNAVYNFSNSTLCRVRKPPTGNIQKCSIHNCTSGRKCAKAHSSIEFQFWHIQQSMYVCITAYVVIFS